MRFIIALFSFFTLLSGPVIAQDVFSSFETGKWGFSEGTEPSCRNNPHTIRFSQDRAHVVFVWSAPIKNYLKQQDASAEYRIISYDNEGIVMALEGEQRRTPEGEPVVWVLKMLPDDMYCWGRTDWPSTGCIAIHIRCPELPPIS